MKLFLVTTLICFEVALANAAERTIPPNIVSVQVSKIEPGKPCLAPACPEDWSNALSSIMGEKLSGRAPIAKRAPR
jgi:hypothetical protein